MRGTKTCEKCHFLMRKGTKIAMKQGEHYDYFAKNLVFNK